MKISYHPTYSQFVDNYLSTYYSGGVRTTLRLIGGPALVLAGVLLIVAANAWLDITFLRYLFYLVGPAISLFGLFITFQPLINVFLVWLRRDALFGPDRPPITIELVANELLVSENDEQITLPLDQIKSVQHRTEGTWVLTQGDYLINIPRKDLLSGDHDVFVSSLEEALAPDEEEE